jgi:type 1 glutamine amidotransferase
MKKFLLLPLILTVLLVMPSWATAQDKSANSAPLKVLIVAGGCCHDYATQTKLLKSGIEERINAEVTVEYNPSKGTDTTFPIYKSADWAKGYDVILHDECSASVTDKAYVNRILDAHRRGVPAVNLHCAMHSYRWGNFREPVDPGADNAGWYEMIGLQSTGHGPQSPIEVSYGDADHPITKGLQGWTTINEELYNNVRVFQGAQALATGKQIQQPRKRDLKANPNAKPRKSTAVVVWTNQYGPNKTRIFSTTLGHNNETVGDERYLDLVCRGMLWATGNLADDGKPTAAYAK